MSLAFVFPGQGSQSLGMLKELAEFSSIVTDTFTEASDVLKLDLWKLAQEGPETDLNRTENTQPAMLVAGFAVWRVWQANTDLKPVVSAGHSLGEYTALAAAGALPFPEAAALVRDRGLYMQEAVPEGTGGMAAIIGMDDADVEKLCEQAAAGDVISPVNYNSPGQIVIAGTADAVSRAVDLAPGLGAKKAVKLSVSVPSHCALMHPAALKMAERLAVMELGMPEIPVLHNVSGKAESSVEGVKKALASQIESPVRWVDTVNNMASDGVTLCLECGPGRVLTGLSRRITRDLKTLAIYDPASLEKAITAAEEL